MVCDLLRLHNRTPVRLVVVEGQLVIRKLALLQHDAPIVLHHAAGHYLWEVHIALHRVEDVGELSLRKTEKTLLKQLEFCCNLVEQIIKMTIAD